MLNCSDVRPVIPPNRRTILICEDNTLISTGWAMILSDAGYAILGPVATGELALEMALDQPPDLALVDIGLLGPIDGVSVAAELAELGVPVIYVTADYQRASGDGREFAKDVLIKPVRQSALLDSVAQVLRNSIPKSA